jgi:FlaA1/EpsC-like NDP-sugar epimerase
MFHGNEVLPLSALLDRSNDPVYGVKAKELISGKTILVTGAAGSIGSEIVRQVMSLDARTVILVDADEYALYNLHLALHGDALLDTPQFMLANVQHRGALNRIFTSTQPDIVFHAAAHKHLPLLERAPDAAILTNVMGTDNVVRACLESGVERFINISTDKAANPTSVLGMSKRLAEITTTLQADGSTRMGSVRFGNVYGSRGSLVETLARGLKVGAELSVTHPGASRFFMSIPEAAGLVIEAATKAVMGETFVLDMGLSINIVELIERYATVAGFDRPNIRFTGLRDGEKLHEQLYDVTEVQTQTDHARIGKVVVNASRGASLQEIRTLYPLAEHHGSHAELYAELHRLVRGDELTLDALI